MHRREFLSFGSAIILIGTPRSVLAQQPGTFSSLPQLEFFAAQRARLLSAFTFVDRNSQVWSVPRGYVTDGASIPRFLWSLVGGPFTGIYLDAAIIHDYFCDNMKRSWQSTHRVFYEGMIARGVSKTQAQSFYYAVYNYGPRWDATHRWTSFLKINVVPRNSVSALRLPASQKEAVATSITENKLAVYEAAEHERASQIIAEGNFEIEEVEAIEPAGTFNFEKEYAASLTEVEQVARFDDQGRLLVPQQFIEERSFSNMLAKQRIAAPGM
jgi:DNA-binding transcriptional regulator/RsmH inhibitor MraZ